MERRIARKAGKEGGAKWEGKEGAEEKGKRGERGRNVTNAFQILDPPLYEISVGDFQHISGEPVIQKEMLKRVYCMSHHLSIC